MSSIVVSGDTSGAVTISAPAVAGTTTLTLPSTSGTVLTTASTTGISGSAISSGTVAEAYGGTGTNTGYYGFKNRIINGAMVIDQRNAGASYAALNNTYGSCDRWFTRSYASGATTGKFTVQKSSTAPAGFSNSILITSSAATSVSTSSIYTIGQQIEGFNVADLAWGTADAKPITISFWVRCSLTGTFGGSIKNADSNRSYPWSYTISSANTWEYKTVTIAGDTSGTWNTDNSVGMMTMWGLGVSSGFSNTAGAWAAGDYYSPTGATSLVSTNGATFYITGVQLEKGSTATSFDYRPFTNELILCERYFYKSYELGTAVGTGTATGITRVASPGTFSGNEYGGPLPIKVDMRATPTVTLYSQSGASGKWRVYPSDTDQTTTLSDNSSKSSLVVISGRTGDTFIQGQYTADAEL